MPYEIGDIVLVRYEDELIQGQIVSIKEVTAGYLWWKKKVKVASIEMPILRRCIFSDQWEKSTEYTQVSLDKLTLLRKEVQRCLI